MQGTIRCYRNARFLTGGVKTRIVGVDMNDMTYNFVGVDAFYKVSRCDDENYLSELLEICKKENVDVLIPCNTAELEKLSEHRQVFDDIGTTVLVSELEGLAIANDKIKSYEFFKENNILTPRTLITSSYEVLRAFLDENKETTFVMKQRHGCGSRGFRIIGKNEDFLAGKPNGVFIDDEELKRVLCGTDEYIIQEYLEGDEYSVDCVANKGEVFYSVCKLNENMENGVARKSTVVENPACISQCVEVCNKLKLHGNIGFDLKCNKDGVPIIIDVNPRLTATVSLAEVAGVNLPFMALGLALYRPVFLEYELKLGTTIVRRIQDYFFDKEGKIIGR